MHYICFLVSDGEGKHTSYSLWGVNGFSAKLLTWTHLLPADSIPNGKCEGWAEVFIQGLQSLFWEGASARFRIMLCPPLTLNLCRSQVYQRVSSFIPLSNSRIEHKVFFSFHSRMAGQSRLGKAKAEAVSYRRGGPATT